MTGRELLAEVADPAALARVGDDDDLLGAGLDSADLVRLTLLIEDRCGVALDADDVDGVRTLRDVDALLERIAARQSTTREG